MLIASHRANRSPVKLEAMILLVVCLFNLIIGETQQRHFADPASFEREWLQDQLRQNPEDLEAAPRLWFGPLMAGMGQAVQPILLMLGLHSALMMFPQMVQKAIAPKYASFFRWRSDMDRMSPRIKTAWKLLHSGWEKYEQLPQPLPYQY